MITLTALVVPALLACAPEAPSQGRSLALQDDAGIVTVTWDGAMARVYRGDRLVGDHAAESWDAAMWSVDIPSYGPVTAPHHFDRPLTAREVASLSSCTWPATDRPVSCGMDVRCACGQPTRVPLVVSALGGT